MNTDGLVENVLHQVARYHLIWAKCHVSPRCLALISVNLIASLVTNYWLLRTQAAISPQKLLDVAVSPTFARSKSPDRRNLLLA